MMWALLVVGLLVVGFIGWLVFFAPGPIESAPALPGWFAVVDCETSCLDPDRGALLSIGAVVPATGDRYYREARAYVGACIDHESLAVNGFTLEQITDPSKLSEAELFSDFARWMGRRGIRLIGGKNPSFDRDWLKAAWKRANLPGRYMLTHRTIDLHSLAWAWALRHRPEVLVESSTLRSDELYPLLGLEPEPKPHHALTGAVMEAEAFEVLLGVKGGAK